MTKIKKYKYLGRNGVLVTRIQIDGVNYIPMTELIASEGMILTDGERLTYSITVEDEFVGQWSEIPDKVN